MEAKYRNPRFSDPSSNNECKDLLLRYINSNKKNHAEKRTSHAYSYIKELSKQIESFIRSMYGSEKDRYLTYDVIYKGKYEAGLREVDLLKLVSPTEIVIGEVKLTCNKRNAIHSGLKQLKKRAEILKPQYTNIKCELIIVDILNNSTEELTDETLFSNSKTIKNEEGFQYNLIVIPAFQLFKYMSAKKSATLEFKELQNNAENEAQEYYEKRMQSKMEKISEKIERMIFGEKQDHTLYDFQLSA